ncbi:hypothetical protein B5F76_02825 [Desulfovibrio sp. An276]|uniref:SIS domain-containing protein n=1 Tax=Desulfovibrio sp. An276 TaxID=1965618 RepID=UPI000B399B8E|nr:SIS domain-containing protein [Desulfovibrio sp. An276]OUO54394.1 hypothetical protein B5F76_02825 [Desulfovibrio sp. An276]
MPFELGLKDDCPELIAQRADASLKVTGDFYDMFSSDIHEVARLLALAFYSEQHVYVAGLGISAHLAAIFASRFMRTTDGRAPLPVQVLSPSLWLEEDRENGTEFSEVFARQIEAHCADGDVLVLITQDGMHPALQAACRAAREQNMFTIGLTGGDGGLLGQDDLLDMELRVPSIEEGLVHELHMNLVCLLDDLVDYYLSGKPELVREMLQAGASSLREDLDRA